MKTKMKAKAPVRWIRLHLKKQRYRCGFTSCLHGRDENSDENNDENANI